MGFKTAVLPNDMEPRERRKVKAGLAVVVLGIVVGAANTLVLVSAAYGHLTLDGADRVVVALGIPLGVAIAVVGNLIVQRVRIRRFRAQGAD